jgi:hypothetical protein
MRTAILLWALTATLACRVALAGEAILVVPNAHGATPRVSTPVGVEIDLDKALGPGANPGRLHLAEIGSDGKPGAAIPVQFERDPNVPIQDKGPQVGTLWWILDSKPPAERRFRLGLEDAMVRVPMAIQKNSAGDYYDVSDSGRPVLRFNHGIVPVPQGLAANYARAGYIHPVFGPSGERLSDDYAADHPHHRGVGWSWPVTRWKDEVRDIWACVGVWSRPVAMRRTLGGRVLAILDSEHAWKWGDTEPIVREEVTLRAFRLCEAGRFVDVEVRLTALADGVAIGGRPHAGYGGFGLRGAPAKDRKITAGTNPVGSSRLWSWLDYSGVFAGGQGPAGIAIFEHNSNLYYPNKLHQYPECNYVMPAFPGEREVALVKGKTLVLKHRLWIHAGYADEKTLADVCAGYTNPPVVQIAK